MTLDDLIVKADLADRTDRLMLADALEEAGRPSEACLLRSGSTVWRDGVRLDHWSAQAPAGSVRCRLSEWMGEAPQLYVFSRAFKNAMPGLRFIDITDRFPEAWRRVNLDGPPSECRCWFPRRVGQADHPALLPPEIFDQLQGRPMPSRDRGTFKWSADLLDARGSLSNACFRWLEREVRNTLLSSGSASGDANLASSLTSLSAFLASQRPTPYYHDLPSRNDG